MKTTRRLFCLMLATASVGCAGPGYWSDRGNDALDILTLTVGAGAGAGARVGPLHAGLGLYCDMVGMRGSTVDYWPLITRHTGGVTFEATLYAFDEFDTEELNGPTDDRNKNVKPVSCPLVSYVTSRRIGTGENASVQPPPYSYYTQIEVFAGAIPGLRAGFNPGELVDFLLGWTTLDIYNDDLGARQLEGNHR